MLAEILGIVLKECRKIFGRLLVEGGITKKRRNTHFLKKQCDILMLLEQEFTRPCDSRKSSSLLCSLRSE